MRFGINQRLVAAIQQSLDGVLRAVLQRSPFALLALSLILLPNAVRAQSRAPASVTTKANHFWNWGWGTYDATPDERNIAAFDWSFIHVGNQVNNHGRIGNPDELIKRLDRILELNPKHKFVVLFWPLFQVRSSHPHFSLFDYLYNSAARKKVESLSIALM